MKKALLALLIGGGSALLLLCLLFGAFFAGPLFASAGPTKTAPTPAPTATTKTTNQYCQQYQQDLAKRLGVSVSTLQKDRLAAAEDVLAQLVKDGKLTQSQANRIRSRMASHMACTDHWHMHMMGKPR